MKSDAVEAAVWMGGLQEKSYPAALHCSGKYYKMNKLSESRIPAGQDLYRES